MLARARLELACSFFLVARIVALGNIYDSRILRGNELVLGGQQLLNFRHPWTIPGKSVAVQNPPLTPV